MEKVQRCPRLSVRRHGIQRGQLANELAKRFRRVILAEERISAVDPRTDIKSSDAKGGIDCKQRRGRLAAAQWPHRWAPARSGAAGSRPFPPTREQTDGTRWTLQRTGGRAERERTNLPDAAF